MVNVTHYGDDRCSRLQFAFRIFVKIQAFFRLFFHFFGNHDADTQILCQHLYHVLIDGLVQSRHDAHLHQGHDNRCRRDFCLLCQTRNGNRNGYRNGAFRQKLFNIHFRLHVLRCLLLLMSGLLFQRILVEVTSILSAAVSFMTTVLVVTIASAAVFILVLIVVKELLALSLSALAGFYRCHFRCGCTAAAALGMIVPAFIVVPAISAVLAALTVFAPAVIAVVSLLSAVGRFTGFLRFRLRCFGCIENLLEAHRLVRSVGILFFLFLCLLRRLLLFRLVIRCLLFCRLVGSLLLRLLLGLLRRLLFSGFFFFCGLLLCSCRRFFAFNLGCGLYDFQSNPLLRLFLRRFRLYRCRFRSFFLLLLRHRCRFADNRRCLNLRFLGLGFRTIVSFQHIDGADDSARIPILHAVSFAGHLNAQLVGISFQFLIRNIQFGHNIRYLLRHSLPPLQMHWLRRKPHLLFPF